MKKKFLIVVGSFFAIAVTSCSKNDDNNNVTPGGNQCPVGYMGAGCTIPWNLGANGLWQDQLGKQFAIIASVTDPKAFVVKSYFLGDSKNSQPPTVDVIGTFSDSVSFTLQPTDLQYHGDLLLSGNGKVSSNGLQVTGSYIRKVTHITGVNQQGQYYYDTTQVSTNYTWSK